MSEVSRAICQLKHPESVIPSTFLKSLYKVLRNCIFLTVVLFEVVVVPQKNPLAEAQNRAARRIAGCRLDASAVSLYMIIGWKAIE